MSKSTFRHAGSRAPRGVISHFGAHRAGESGQHAPRHAAGELSREGCFSGGDIIKAIAGLAAIAVTAAGAVSVGASIDEKYDRANTSIQQPAEEEPDEGTDKSLQPTGLDSVDDQSPEARRIVIDGASRVSACDIRSQQGKLKKKVICTHPDVFGYPGARPAHESSSNIPQVSADSRKQPTSA